MPTNLSYEYTVVRTSVPITFRMASAIEPAHMVHERSALGIEASTTTKYIWVRHRGILYLFMVAIFSKETLFSMPKMLFISYAMWHSHHEDGTANQSTKTKWSEFTALSIFEIWKLVHEHTCVWNWPLSVSFLM